MWFDVDLRNQSLVNRIETKSQSMAGRIEA